MAGPLALTDDPAAVYADPMGREPVTASRPSGTTRTGSPSPADAAAVEESSLALVELTLAALAEARGVSLLQMRVLLIVDRHSPLNLSSLAAHLGLSVPSASRLVERLVDADLVRRETAEHSRREVMLALTASGRRALNRLRRARRQSIDGLLGRLTPAERAALVSGLTAFAAAAAD